MRQSTMRGAGVVGLLLLGSACAVACSDGKRPGSAIGAAGSSSSGSANLPRGGAEPAAGADAGGSDAMAAGQGGSGTAGDADVGGQASAGDAGSLPVGGAAPDPIPPVGDPPVCAHGQAFAAGTRLALSGAGDDVLQALSPSGLTLAWKNGEHFYVADFDPESEVFMPAHEVAGGAQYRAITLSRDGLQLFGVTQELAIVEQTRGPLEAFDDPAPGDGAFAGFNTTRSSIPLADQELADLVAGPDDASLFFSHFTTGYTGSRPTLFETHLADGAWPFSSPDLGKLLYANDEQRRIPTGISSDRLTLFYLDEVNGDFRAAWRVNTQVPFDYSEVLELATGVKAAAPTASCQRIYYSAPGTNGLDLFFADAAP
jgi:hypothetical protein